MVTLPTFGSSRQAQSLGYERIESGYDVAHPWGREAAKGHNYRETYLQLKLLHRIQHAHDDYGKAVKHRTGPPRFGKRL